MPPPPPRSVTALTILALLTGCTAEHYQASADRQVYSMLKDREQKTLAYQLGNTYLKQFKESLEALLAVAGKSTEPEVTALSLIEAAFVAGKLGQREQGEKLLQQVVDGYPQTSWAAAERSS